jgi:hypothetical protein
MVDWAISAPEVPLAIWNLWSQSAWLTSTLDERRANAASISEGIKNVTRKPEETGRKPEDGRIGNRFAGL